MSRGSFIKAAKFVGAWLPALLLVLIFAPQGWSKFFDSSGWAAAFRAWGYPDWFRVTIGAIELLAVACLFWSRSAPIGALMIMCVMLGAWATHIIFDHGRHMTSEIVPLVLATVVVALRRRELRELIDRLRRRTERA